MQDFEPLPLIPPVDDELLELQAKVCVNKQSTTKFDKHALESFCCNVMELKPMGNIGNVHLTHNTQGVLDLITGEGDIRADSQAQSHCPSDTKGTPL